MPPKVKFRRQEIVAAAVNVARAKGIDAVTAREVARELGVSTRPIFTYFDTIEQLREAVFEWAKACCRKYVGRALADPFPLFAPGLQYLRFAREEPELYKLLFLPRPGGASGSAMELLRFSRDMARSSTMCVCNMDAQSADRYFFDLWLVVFSLATLIATGECPYTDAEIQSVLAEVSLAVCKAHKEIPGFAEQRFDRDAIFRELASKQCEAAQTARTML